MMKILHISAKGLRSGIDGAHLKGVSRVIILPSPSQLNKQSKYPTFFPTMKFNYLKTSTNEERGILRSTSDFHRTKGMVIKSYLKKMNLNGNEKPISRSASMIGYLGDTSKVEQQLTMASGLVSEENPMLGSLIGKTYSSHKADHLANLIRNFIASKHNYNIGRDQQALVDHGSIFRYSVQGNGKNSDSNSHIKHLGIEPQRKEINLSGIYPRDDSRLERREKDTPLSHDGVLNMEKVRSRRSIERAPRLLGHVNVAVNKGRTKRESVDLTNLLPPTSLQIGRTARKSDDSESTEDTSENERRGLSMDKIRSKRSTENLSRLLGSVDVTLNKGRAKRATVDLDDLLPGVSLVIGKRANSGSKANKKGMGRARRASVDLSGILPTTNLQVGKSERSIPDSEQSQFSDTKQDRALADDPYFHAMLRYFLKNIEKCDELTDDDDLDFSRQSTKILPYNHNK